MSFPLASVTRKTICMSAGTAPTISRLTSGGGGGQQLSCIVDDKEKTIMVEHVQDDHCTHVRHVFRGQDMQWIVTHDGDGLRLGLHDGVKQESTELMLEFENDSDAGKAHMTILYMLEQQPDEAIIQALTDMDDAEIAASLASPDFPQALSRAQAILAKGIINSDKAAAIVVSPLFHTFVKRTSRVITAMARLHNNTTSLLNAPESKKARHCS